MDTLEKELTAIETLVDLYDECKWFRTCTILEGYHSVRSIYTPIDYFEMSKFLGLPLYYAEYWFQQRNTQRQ